MIRAVSLGLLAVALCALQSGCCCCRLPLGGMVVRPPPIVVNQPPVFVNPPPDNNPFPQNDPFKDFANKDAFKEPFKDLANKDPFKDFANKDAFKVPNADKANPQAGDYVYNLRTGQLTLDNQLVGMGFSGVGPAKNNPALQKQPKTGPIPAGDWRIAIRINDVQTGEPNLHLHQLLNPPVRFGEVFTIHADTRPNAGESGIAMPRNVREAIKVGVFTKLKVVQ